MSCQKLPLYIHLFLEVLLHDTKLKSLSTHRWRSPEIQLIFKVAHSYLNTHCELYLSSRLFADVCFWFSDIDFDCSVLKTGIRPMF